MTPVFPVDGGEGTVTWPHPNRTQPEPAVDDDQDMNQWVQLTELGRDLRRSAFTQASDYPPERLNAVIGVLREHFGWMPLRDRTGLAVLLIEAAQERETELRATGDDARSIRCGCGCGRYWTGTTWAR